MSTGTAPVELKSLEKHMSANILGDRFYGRREPAWHGLGTTFDGTVTMAEAVQNSGANFKVIAVPEPPLEAFGRSIDRGNRIAIVREPLHDDPTPRVLGYATSSYQIMQNMELGQLLQPLSDIWPVETVGVLGAGETIFLTLDAGGSDIKGDPIHEYFLVTDGKTGGSALKVAVTNVRVVCQNTLTAALSSASVSSSIPHKGDMSGNVKFHVDLISSMRKAQAKVREAMVMLAEKHVNADQVSTVLRAAYPDPAKGSRVRMAESLGDNIEQVTNDPSVDQEKLKELLKSTTRYDYYSGRSQAYRDEALGLFNRFNDEQPSLGGTAWALYNAVVELSDYRVGSDGVQYSALFGLRSQEKSRAFAAALKV